MCKTTGKIKGQAAGRRRRQCPRISLLPRPSWAIGIFRPSTIVEMKIALILLAVALLTPSGARADADLTVVASSPSATSFKRYDNKTHLSSTYGEDITVFCTATNVANLTIASQTGELQVDQYNSTTIRALIEKPDVGEHIFHCKDSGGYKQSLIVNVYPAVSGIAPNVRHTFYSHKILFFVPKGESYDVICSANNNESLSLKIYSDKFEKLQTKVTNATVSATVVNDTEGKSYICRKDEIYKFFDVIVDYIPEAQDFQCVFYLRQKLQCTWRSSSTKNTFKLFSKYNLLCTDMSGGESGGCVRAWNRELDDAYAFSPMTTHLPLQLEVCNEVYCNNQTFSIKINSIIKVDAVYNLQVLEDTKEKVSLEWRHRNLLCYRQCDFKVEYRMGMHWHLADISQLQSSDFSSGVWFRMSLPIPCPEIRYEIRVYVKPLSAIGERFWSEPAYVEYVTPPPRVIDPDDVACEEFRRQEPKPAPGALLQEARELVREFRFDQNRKFTEIKALLDSLT